jgi:DNA-directed RNA polymerase specialized sigma24 family protein
MTPQEEMVVCLADAIESLPAELRDVVILHDLLGHPVTEVARRLRRDERARCRTAAAKLSQTARVAGRAP